MIRLALTLIGFTITALFELAVLVATVLFLGGITFTILWGIFSAIA